MKKAFCYAVAMAVFPLVTPLHADEKSEVIQEKKVEAAKPTLTFYYFDG